MRIEPASRGPARLWTFEDSSLAALALWTEKVPGHGEDANPLLLYNRSTHRGLIGVFDGVGAAGRALAGRSGSGVDRTQAWVAGCVVRALVEEWFVTAPGTGLHKHLLERMSELPRERGRLRGTIPRAFPTTLAALDFRLTTREAAWDVLWAGDSRCYVAEPDLGLQQLSRDDSDLQDALDQLVQDPPLTNMVSADRRFALNHWRDHARLPCLLVCATDGVFGYLDTPAQFEHLLWSTLATAQDISHWSVLLTEQISSYTGDDASLVIVALGVTGFDELRVLFRERAERVRINHAEPMDRVRRRDRDELNTARARSWQAYQPTYERRLLAEDGIGG
jgi:serine/threonine protein phosphatase PrpC